MAKKSIIAKAQRKQKFGVRQYNRCPLCGRPRSFIRKFGICRICFRKLASSGEITGVTKSSSVGSGLRFSVDNSEKLKECSLCQ